MYRPVNTGVILWNGSAKTALTWFVLPIIFCTLMIDEQTSIQNGGSLSGAKVYQLHYVDNQDRTHSITELPRALGSNAFKTSINSSATEEIDRFFNANLKAGRITMVAGVHNLNLALLFVSVLLLVAYQARSSVWAAHSQQYTSTHYYLSIGTWLASPLVVAGFFFNGFRTEKWELSGAPDNGLSIVWFTAFGVSLWFFIIESYLRRKALKVKNVFAMTNGGDKKFDLKTDGNWSTYELTSMFCIIGMLLVFAFVFLHFDQPMQIFLVLLVVLGLAFLRHLARRLSLMDFPNDTDQGIMDVPSHLASLIFSLEVLFILLAIFFSVNHWELLTDHVSVFQTGDFFYDGNRWMLSMLLIVVIMIVVGWIAKPFVHDLNLDPDLISNLRRRYAEMFSKRQGRDDGARTEVTSLEEMAREAARRTRTALSSDRASLVRNNLNFV